MKKFLKGMMKRIRLWYIYNGVENNDGGVEERGTIIDYFRNMLTAGGFII